MSDAAALVRRLRSGKRLAQLQALRSLAGLAGKCPEARRDVVAAGGIAAIVQLEGLGSSVAVEQAAAAALFGIAQAASDATLAAFVGAGAIRTLASWLQSSSSSPTLPAYAAGALLCLAACDGGRAAVTAGGAIPPLVALLHAAAGQPNPVAEYRAAAVLSVIAESAQIAEAVVNAGGVPAMVALLERRATARAASYDEKNVLVFAAETLGRLGKHGSAEANVVTRAGGVRCLVGLLSHPSPDVQQPAVSSLSWLLNNCGGARAAFAEAGAAPAAVRLLHSTDESVQVEAARVLGLAACSSAATSAGILAAGAVQPLVQLLHTTNPLVNLCAASALSVLCRMQPAAAAADIQRAGDVLQVLSRLAADSDDEHVRMAASTAKATVAHALSTTSRVQQGSGSSELAAGGAARAGPASIEAPAAHLPARPPRCCAAPGCGVTHGLRRCGGCGAVRYCSTACSRAHWRAHKGECRCLQAAASVAVDDGDGGVASA